MNRLCEIHFSNIEIAIIQCKTNWNDNSQIPMLWDIVYSANGFSKRNIHVGNSMYSIQNIQKFTYSFVTVPTSKEPKDDSITVKRVINISGGNYWGKQSVPGVANSIKNIFGANFRTGASNINSSLTTQLPLLKTNYDYFKLA